MPASSTVRLWVYGILSVALAVALGTKAWAAHRQNVVLQRRIAETDAQVEKLKAEQKRLREESEALKSDPLYLEKLMRQNVAPPPAAHRRP